MLEGGTWVSDLTEKAMARVALKAMRSFSRFRSVLAPLPPGHTSKLLHRSAGEQNAPGGGDLPHRLPNMRRSRLSFDRAFQVVWWRNHGPPRAVKVGESAL